MIRKIEIERLEAVADADEELSSWEIDFIESLSGRDTVTARQLEKFEEIEDRLIEKGVL